VTPVLLSGCRSLLCSRVGPLTALLPRVAENIARKLRRLGVVCASVRFRKLLKVEPALQAFQAEGLRVLSLTHEPRLPKGLPTRARKRRRV